MIIKNGSCDVDKSLRHIMNTIDINIETFVIMSNDLVLTLKPTDCLIYDAIVVCGGQQSLVDRHSINYSHPYLNDLIEFVKIWIQHNICILGICLGAQILGEACGFETTRLNSPVIGYQQTIIVSDSSMLDESDTPFFMCCHHDRIRITDDTDITDIKIKIDAYLRVKTELIPYAFSIKRAYGVQFHPEMNNDMLLQVKCFYAQVGELSEFTTTNEIRIREATIRFFRRWLGMYLT